MATPTDAPSISAASKCFRCLDGAPGSWVEAWLFTQWAGLPSDPNTLVSLSKGFQGLTGDEIQAVIVFLLADIAGGTTDPQTLAKNSACMECLSGEFQAAQIYLLSSITGSSTDPNTLVAQASAFQAIPIGSLAPIIAYALAVKAGGTTDPQALSGLAACYRCALLGGLNQVGTYLMAQIGGGVLPPFNCTTFLDNSVNSFNFTSLNNVTCLSFPNLNAVNTASAVITTMPDLQTVTFASPGFINFLFGTLAISSNPKLSSIAFNTQVFWSPSGNNFSNNASLTNFTVTGAWSMANNYTFTWAGCSLAQASVDGILLGAAMTGTTGGTIHLEGGSNATPSATGLGYKAILAGRGWTVTNN